MPTIRIETVIEAPVHRVFDLSRSIDLHMISTKETNEKAIAGRTSGLIELGEIVTWQAKHYGFTQNLTSKITAFEFPNHFTDEMVNGAFKSFKHQHLFDQTGGKTLVVDIFDFESPFGLFGRLFNSLTLTDYMLKLLAKRNEVIKDFAETDKWKKVL